MKTIAISKSSEKAKIKDWDLNQIYEKKISTNYTIAPNQEGFPEEHDLMITASCQECKIEGLLRKDEPICYFCSQNYR